MFGRDQEGHRGRGPKNYTRSDDRIREDVNDQLEQHDELDAHEIEVRVSQGIVSLSGTVPDRWMKRMAEDIADSCRGVKDVRNELRVESHEHEQQGMSQRGSSQGSSGSMDSSASGGTRERNTTTAGRP